jgi:predicted HAD superfamily Cof-like phosphohydrolase
MKKQLEHVQLFHEIYKVGYAQKPTADLNKETVLLRHRLMTEENEEYLEAAINQDLVGIADALGDMLYILCGTIISHGLQDKIEDVFEAIQKSNMSKLDENGQPLFREDGKVIKGPNYFPPDIKAALDL